MLIVSWNVAGLKPALERIHTDYGADASCSASNKLHSSQFAKPTVNVDASGETSSTTGNRDREIQRQHPSTTNGSSPFATFLRLHGDVSILCLQEHKIPHSQLSSRSEPHRCSALPGYESFWSCFTDPKARKGFNGVVTYVKTGMVQSADVAPLRDPSLDGEGRCVMTDHGDWVLFNVYVPCGSDEETLPKKMTFLNALRKSMKRQREEMGKRVVLVGDMNLKHCAKDVYWKYRVLNVDEVLGRMQCTKNEIDDNQKENDRNLDFPKWKVDLENQWDRILTVLQSLQVSCEQ